MLGQSRPQKPCTTPGSARSEEMADGLDEFSNRDRLRQVSLTAAFANALLVTLHGECRNCNHRNGFELGIILELFGHFDDGVFRSLNVHHNYIGSWVSG